MGSYKRYKKFNHEGEKAEEGITKKKTYYSNLFAPYPPLRFFLYKNAFSLDSLPVYFIFVIG
jgi:hypothetical protein